MKKIILSCAAALLAIGSAHATPKFLSLNNKHGKTTIKIEIPASDRDETNGLSIEDVVCTLSFSLNGEPVSLDIQSCLADRK